MNNLSVKTKSVIPLLLMAGLFIGVIAKSANTMLQMSSRYSAITLSSAPAVLNIARFTRSLTNLSVDALLLASYKCTEGDASKCQSLLVQVQQEEAYARRLLDVARTADPSRQPEIADYDKFLDHALAELKPLLDAGMRDDAAVGPGISAFTLEMKEFMTATTAANQTITDRDDRVSKELQQDAAGNLWLVICVGLVAVSIGAGFTVWVAVVKISQPLQRLSAAMRTLADGDLSAEVAGQERRDEIGAMAQAVQVLKDNAVKAVAQEADAVAARAGRAAERSRIEAERAKDAAEDEVAIAALAEGLGALAAGNLVHQITADVAPKTRQLKDDFNVTATRLRETMNGIASAIHGMTSGTSEISQASDDLSRRTEQQAASLEQTAAALDQITATVRTTADSAGHVRGIIATAKQDAEHSQAVVQDTVVAMGEIESSAQQVSQIIGVIDEIAFQTNLLALNAGVEAARAGDAGRGFAVVAQEVRALAQRSAQAAKEIKQLISTSSKQVDRGVKLVDETGQSLNRIAVHVAEIYASIVAIAASAQEQASGLLEVNTAINQMDQVTQQNAAMVEQSTAASHSLVQETEALGRLTGYFQIGERLAAAPVRAPARAPLKVVRGGRPALAVANADADGWKEF